MRNAGNKEPLYDVDWIKGRAVELFYADGQLAREFGGYWWPCLSRVPAGR
jgi:hypothetical protein